MSLSCYGNYIADISPFEEWLRKKPSRQGYFTPQN